jgi:hypothetical protein
VCQAELSDSPSWALPVEKDVLIPPSAVAVPRPTEGNKVPVEVLASGGRELKFHCATISARRTIRVVNKATPVIEVLFITAHRRLWIENAILPFATTIESRTGRGCQVKDCRERKSAKAVNRTRTHQVDAVGLAAAITAALRPRWFAR